MLPSMSTETKLSARSMSRALGSLVSRAWFHELSSASTREPSSDGVEVCAAARHAASPSTNVRTKNGRIAWMARMAAYCGRDSAPSQLTRREAHPFVLDVTIVANPGMPQGGEVFPQEHFVPAVLYVQLRACSVGV